jgi:hypothetical protein
MVYNVYMIRKQVYLTPQIDRELDIVAKQEGKSVAEVIRERLEKSLRIKKDQPQNGAEVLLKMAKNASSSGVEDLSTNLFDYLYGDKSPNYGKNAPKLTKAEEKRIEKFINERRQKNHH